MAGKAIIFGAGNIGRGFIGQLFCESGYSVTFVDVDRELIDSLNKSGSYRLQTVYNEDVNDYRIGPVRALHGDCAEDVEIAVAEAEIGATAVGAGALKFIAPRIAGGIERRMRRQAGPINFIICENLKGAAAAMRAMAAENIAASCRAYLDEHVGFVDTVIGRMVPTPTPAMRAEDVSLIRVEPYKELPVDRKGFAGVIPEIVAMDPQPGFPLYTARKLYIHNCGHALLAYVGNLRGHTYGYEALEDAAVRQVLDGGLAESIDGIVAKYGAERAWLEEHRRDLMLRFANRALGDTIFRLGRDPARKLSPGDRLAGSAAVALEAGQVPRHLAWGIAAALLFAPAGDPAAMALQARISESGVATVLREVTGISPESDLGKAVMRFHAVLAADPGAEIPPAYRYELGAGGPPP